MQFINDKIWPDAQAKKPLSLNCLVEIGYDLENKTPSPKKRSLCFTQTLAFRIALTTARNSSLANLDAFT
jgi:hypothetical protein